MSTLDRYKVEIPEATSGEWSVEKFTVEDGFRLRMDPRAPTVGETYTRLMRDQRYDPVMSDTPAEIRDLLYVKLELQRPSVKTVLINGLGLGIVLKMALEQPHIERLDVVEISPEVIRLVAPYYDDPRVSIHQADAYILQWPTGQRWDVVWHDIWDDICTDNLEGMGKLHRRYGRRCEWQGSWQREYLQYRKRQERDRYW